MGRAFLPSGPACAKCGIVHRRRCVLEKGGGCARGVSEGQHWGGFTKEMGAVFKLGSDGSCYVGDRVARTKARSQESWQGTRSRLGRWPWGWNEGAPLCAPSSGQVQCGVPVRPPSFFSPSAHHPV